MKKNKTKKKLYFKDWVVNTLWIINIICFLLIGSESDNWFVFIIIKLIGLILILFNFYLLNKYSRG